MLPKFVFCMKITLGFWSFRFLPLYCAQKWSLCGFIIAVSSSAVVCSDLTCKKPYLLCKQCFTQIAGRDMKLYNYRGSEHSMLKGF